MRRITHLEVEAPILMYDVIVRECTVQARICSNVYSLNQRVALWERNIEDFVVLEVDVEVIPNASSAGTITAADATSIVARPIIPWLNA